MADLSLFTLVPRPSPGRSGTANVDTVSADCYDTVLEDCVAAERLGFRAVYFGEHHFDDLSLSPSPNLLIAAAVRQTTTLRLGAMVTPTALHHSWRVAEEAIMLDHLSRGRVDIGLGSGLAAPALEAHGITSRHNQDQFRQTVEEIVSFLSTGRPKNQQDHCGRLLTEPWTAPHPPIWVPVTSAESASWAGLAGHGIVCGGANASLDRLLAETYREAFEAARHPADSKPRVGLRRRVNVVREARPILQPARRPTDLVVGTPDYVRSALDEQARHIGASELLLWFDHRSKGPGRQVSWREFAEETLFPSEQSVSPA